MALFADGKRLDALPILESLAQKDPNDGEVLVELAASLVEHAATVADTDAAAKERFRARNLVEKAWGLGNTSPLAENLRQLLRELPVTGKIQFSNNPAVEQAINAGEAAFARRQFDEARKDYAVALDLEPTNYSAVLFTANAYDKEKEFTEAGEWYERAMRMEPNVETAYRYYADMAAKIGDMAKARRLLIEAAVAEPYNKIVWREIRAWAIINHTAFNIVYVGVPVPGSALPIASAEERERLATAWKTYYSVKSEWKKGGKFLMRFPREAEYRHSLPEESEALTATSNAFETLKADPETAELVASDPNASLLLKLRESGLIDAYVLFSLGDEGIAQDYAAYRAKNREKLATYMDKFVMPPAPPQH